MVEYIRFQTRGGARNTVGRTGFRSDGSRDRLSENHTGVPIRIGTSSSTMRWAMCADGRKTTVESPGVMGSTMGPISRLARIARWLVSPILGAPVAPDVR